MKRIAIVTTLLSFAWFLSAQDAPAGDATMLSEQAQTAIESEGVLGGSGAGTDTPSGMVVAYQVGAFKDRAGANRLIEALAKVDFVGYLYLKRVGGTEYWTILVSAANNPFENRADELKQAGFDSIPITKGNLDSTMRLVPGQ